MQDRRGRRIALIGDDLVAGIIEVKPGQRDNRTGGNRGGRRVGDRSFARPESAGGQPAVVGEIDAVPASTSRVKTNVKESVVLLLY